jgi:hypothetical protein
MNHALYAHMNNKRKMKKKKVQVEDLQRVQSRADEDGQGILTPFYFGENISRRRQIMAFFPTDQNVLSKKTFFPTCQRRHLSGKKLPDCKISLVFKNPC